jgi:hypothetical protein
MTTDPLLRADIGRDLQPVSPLPRPLARAAWVAPLGLLLLFAARVVFSLRVDAPRLGWWLTWGASLVETLLGLGLIAASLRESVPGTTLSRRAMTLAFLAGAVAIVAITWTTWIVSGTTLARDPRWFVWRVCVGGSILSAMLPLGLSAALVARAFPLRPALAGALYGLGSGLLADAGWRLFCHFSNPAHVFGAHTLAIAAVTAAGASIAGALAHRGVRPGSDPPFDR